ncbi:hypothetical protein AAVH_41937, partial [Aphelenchoides avenae]
SFVRDGCANTKLESVYLRWDDGDGPQPATPKLLSKPSKSDMRLPKNDLTAWLIRDGHEVSPCEMHSFVSSKQRKRMDVYKWSVHYDLWGSRRMTHVLQCLVKTL